MQWTDKTDGVDVIHAADVNSIAAAVTAAEEAIDETQRTLSQVEDDMPTKLSDLENDSGFVTASQAVRFDETQSLQEGEKAIARVNIGAAAEEDIPTQTSQLENDSDFVTTSQAVRFDEEQLLSPPQQATARNNMNAAYKFDVETIKAVIPDQASEDNQLADKDFVNSSVSTNMANYISNNGQPFTSVAQLEAYSGTVTNNDYAFVTGTDSSGNTYYDRYKARVEDGRILEWALEYRLNNSSFTAAQWAAIESGITYSLVTKLQGIEAGAQVNPDLTSYVKNTDFATNNKGGVVQVTNGNGLSMTSDGKLRGNIFTSAQYEAASNNALLCRGTLDNVLNAKTSNDISSQSTNSQFASAKAVYDFIMSLDGNGVAY